MIMLCMLHCNRQRPSSLSLLDIITYCNHNIRFPAYCLDTLIS
jgi:hypothetical protein